MTFGTFFSSWHVPSYYTELGLQLRKIYNDRELGSRRRCVCFYYGNIWMRCLFPMDGKDRVGKVMQGIAFMSPAIDFFGDGPEIHVSAFVTLPTLYITLRR